MKKFGIIAALVFATAIGAEWFILGAPDKGVVLDANYEPVTDSFKLRIMTSEGTYMNVKMSPKVWREWWQIRRIEEK